MINQIPKAIDYVFRPGDLATSDVRLTLRSSCDVTAVPSGFITWCDIVVVIAINSARTIPALKQFSAFDDVMVCGSNCFGWTKANFLKHI